MIEKSEIVLLLLTVYRDVTGREANGSSRLADTLSSLELMQFLMAYEEKSALMIDFDDLQVGDLISIDTLAHYLERSRP